MPKIAKTTSPMLNIIVNFAESIKAYNTLKNNPNSTQAERDSATASLVGAIAAVGASLLPKAFATLGVTASVAGLEASFRQLGEAQSAYNNSGSGSNRDALIDKTLGVASAFGQLAANVPGVQVAGLLLYAYANAVQTATSSEFQTWFQERLEASFPGLGQRGLPLFTPSPATRIDEGVAAKRAAVNAPTASKRCKNGHLKRRSYYKNSSKQCRGCWTNGRFGSQNTFLDCLPHPSGRLRTPCGFGVLSSGSSSVDGRRNWVGQEGLCPL